MAVPEVLIDSGATCNVMGQQTWETLKLKGIKCEPCKSARELFAYSSTEPLPTLGTFTADVMLNGNSNGCRADFVVVKGDGCTLLGRETVEVLNLLHTGPFQANNVGSGGLESCIREKYKAMFTGVSLLKGYELKLHIDESVKTTGATVRLRKRRWHWFGPVSDSTCMCPEEVLNWKRITNPWNESIYARQSLVRELRGGCCGYKGMTLKLCTGLGKQTLLMHYLI